MDNPNPTPEITPPQPEPIIIPPEPPQEIRRDDVLVINQTTLYMFLTAIVFFAAGFIVAWLTFQTRADDIRNTASGAAREAIRTAIAELGGNAPTATPIPRQNVKFDDSMPSWGPADAKVTIVEFSDLQCPFCESFYQRTYQQLKTEYGDKIRFVFRHFPIASLHPDAENTSYAAECAKEQGRFWEFHNVVLNNNGNNLSHDQLIEHARTAQVPNIEQFTQCLDSQKYKSVIDEDIKAGDSYYVTGTPTFFINGNILIGAQPYELFKAKIDQAFQAAGG
jgi:protein-disulfide isomerase